jgi:glycine betaine/proline transport system permease protein
MAVVQERLEQLSEAGPLRYVLAPLGAILSIPKWVWLTGLMLAVGTLAFREVLPEVPEEWLVGPQIARAVDRGVDWMVVNWDPFFSAVNLVLLHYLLLPLERWLLGLPWWLVMAAVAFISLRMVGPVFALLAAGMVLALAAFGLFDLTMATLALVIVATLVAVVVGVPTGIAMAKSTRLDGAIRPVLDLMQTMPSFVYLIPVLMLFGLGKVPAVVAVVIYAVPPIIRLTSLGIRQVDASVIEAARAFGATGLQLLLKVQLPLAVPTIMAGLNQTIMMALGMVVIASMIGATGLGVEVLNGIARLEVGRGLLGGIGIVIMAIILDRITQGLARSQRATRPSS